MRFPIIYGTIAAGCLAALGSAAFAQNIVSNPGFESGAFTPWSASTTGSYSVTNDNSSFLANSGNFAADFQPLSSGTPGTGTLTQTLTTVPGQSYTLDFWMSDANSLSIGPDPFNVMWNGAALPTLSIPADVDYHEFTFSVAATGASTDLSFVSPEMAADAGEWHIRLDDVSVTAAGAAATPEPGAIALLGTSLVSGLLIRRRRAARRQ